MLKDYYDAFEVHMESANSYIYGIIMFEKFFMTIFFEKSISNNTNSKGFYDYLFFEATQRKGLF